jgi:hypothetical protein
MKIVNLLCSKIIEHCHVKSLCWNVHTTIHKYNCSREVTVSCIQLQTLNFCMAIHVICKKFYKKKEKKSVSKNARVDVYQILEAPNSLFQKLFLLSLFQLLFICGEINNRNTYRLLKTKCEIVHSSWSVCSSYCYYHYYFWYWKSISTKSNVVLSNTCTCTCNNVFSLTYTPLHQFIANCIMKTPNKQCCMDMDPTHRRHKKILSIHMQRSFLGLPCCFAKATGWCEINQQTNRSQPASLLCSSKFQK